LRVEGGRHPSTSLPTVPILDLDLDPPLRSARPSDAMTIAVLSNEAGCGIPWHLKTAKADAGGEAWTQGAAAMPGEIAAGALVANDANPEARRL
tara:strand:+ start:1438 stop:1719 length:282 start_codon:yes stop_codon:yes gene_type:complete